MINSITVSELIEALKRCDPHKPVVLAGGGRMDTVEEKFIEGHSVVDLTCKEPVPKRSLAKAECGGVSHD